VRGPAVPGAWVCPRGCRPAAGRGWAWGGHAARPTALSSTTTDPARYVVDPPMIAGASGGGRCPSAQTYVAMVPCAVPYAVACRTHWRSMKAIQSRCHAGVDELTPTSSGSHWYSSTRSTIARSSAAPARVMADSDATGCAAANEKTVVPDSAWNGVQNCGDAKRYFGPAGTRAPSVASVDSYGTSSLFRSRAYHFS